MVAQENYYVDYQLCSTTWAYEVCQPIVCHYLVDVISILASREKHISNEREEHRTRQLAENFSSEKHERYAVHDYSQNKHESNASEVTPMI